MRIRMKKTRNWTMPSDRRVTIKYLEGKAYSIKRAWGLQLVEAGDAEEVPAPVRPEGPARVPRPRGPRRRKAAAV